MKWLMVGTSPSVLRTLPLFDGASRYRTITTNAGIRLIPCPDVFVLIDHLAMREYHAAAMKAKESGAHLVTLHRERPMPDRRADDYSEHVEVGGEPTRDSFGEFRLSGPFCLEYACHNGASEIHMIGFDGYRWQGDYYADRLPSNNQQNGSQRHGVQRTHSVMKPRCEELARVWSDVRFIQYGEPTFRVESDNWEVELC